MVLLLAAVLAQDAGPILRPEENGKTMLYEHLRAECGKRFEARAKDIEALRTPDDVRRRQADLRAKFVASLGGFPERTPLNAKVVGTLKGAGFRVEKVIFESRPSHAVTAALFLPDGAGPFPGVLVPCGHSENGKAADAYQRACILLAKNGIAAFIYDPIGQGERRQALGPGGHAAVKSTTNEHTMAGIGAWLVGWSCATFRIWDGMRALDYLEGRPEIDAKRLGCAGNSGGGTLTSYLMALDGRIAAAAPSCYLTTLERLFATIGPQDAEQIVAGQVAFGMDHADYVTMRAPSPVLMNVAMQDYFDLTGARTSFREAKRIYGLLGAEDQVAIFEFDDKHGWSKPRRESAMRWMRKWLLRSDEPRGEPEFEVFKDAELQCTASGQVMKEPGARSVFHFIADRERALAAKRENVDIVGVMRRRLRVEDAPSPARLLRRGEGSYVADLGPLKMPLLRRGSGAGSAVVIVDPAGKSLEAMKPFAAEKVDVYAVDLPGWGETAMHSGGKPFGPDWKESALGIFLGRPLLGLRVEALRRLLAAIEAPDGVRLVGLGAAGPVVLHVAVIDPRVSAVTVDGSILSWGNVARTEVTDDQYSNVVPGVLEAYDLPDVVAAMAPRPVTVRNARDGAGKPVAAAAAKAAWPRARVEE